MDGCRADADADDCLCLRSSCRATMTIAVYLPVHVVPQEVLEFPLCPSLNVVVLKISF